MFRLEHQRDVTEIETPRRFKKRGKQLWQTRFEFCIGHAVAFEAIEIMPEWAVRDRFPLRNVALISGEGSTGKSILIMQLGAAHVLAMDWAHALPEPGSFLYFGAEDEPDELERRLDAIAQHYDVPLRALERDYHMISRAGQDAVLGYPDRSGLIRPTPLFEELKEAARELCPKTIALDTSADIFGGNEVNRTQVRQFERKAPAA
jgi:RecA-family ATPase